MSLFALGQPRDAEDDTMADEKPDADVAEQQRPALRDDLEADAQALRDDFAHDTADPAGTAIS